MELGRKIAEALEAATFERVAGVGLANAERNRPRIARSGLEPAAPPPGAAAAPLVRGGGRAGACTGAGAWSACALPDSRAPSWPPTAPSGPVSGQEWCLTW